MLNVNGSIMKGLLSHRWTVFNFAKTLTVRIFYITNVLMHNPVNSMKTFFYIHLPNGCSKTTAKLFLNLQ